MLTSCPKLTLNVKLFIISELILGIAIGIWNLYLNFFLKSVGYSSAQLGFIVAFEMFAVAILALPAGHLCYRLGYFQTMLLGCILKTSGMAEIAFFYQDNWIYLGRLINGAGDTLILTSSYPFIVSMVSDDLKTVAYNLLFATTFFANFSGSLLGGQIFKNLAGFNNPYQVTLVISTCLILLVALMRTFLPRQRTITPDQHRLEYNLLCNKIIIKFLFFTLLAYIEYFLVFALLNLILKENFRYSEDLIGGILGLSSLISGLAILMIPFWLKQWSRKHLIFYVLCLLGIVYLLMTLPNHLLFNIFVLISCFLSLTIAGLLDGPMLCSLPESSRSSYSGMKVMINYLGISTGIAIAGLVRNMTTDYRFLFICAAGLLLVQLLVYQFGFRNSIPD